MSFSLSPVPEVVRDDPLGRSGPTYRAQEEEPEGGSGDGVPELVPTTTVRKAPLPTRKRDVDTQVSPGPLRKDLTLPLETSPTSGPTDHRTPTRMGRRRVGHATPLYEGSVTGDDKAPWRLGPSSHKYATRVWRILPTQSRV